MHNPFAGWATCLKQVGRPTECPGGIRADIFERPDGEKLSCFVAIRNGSNAQPNFITLGCP